MDSNHESFDLALIPEWATHQGALEGDADGPIRVWLRETPMRYYQGPAGARDDIGSRWWPRWPNYGLSWCRARGAPRLALSSVMSIESAMFRAIEEENS